MKYSAMASHVQRFKRGAKVHEITLLWDGEKPMPTLDAVMVMMTLDDFNLMHHYARIGEAMEHNMKGSDDGDQSIGGSDRAGSDADDGLDQKGQLADVDQREHPAQD